MYTYRAGEPGELDVVVHCKEGTRLLTDLLELYGQRECLLT
jgi:hypothetical protein